MDNRPSQKLRMKALIGLGIVLIGSLVIIFWKTGNPAISAETKETAGPEKKESARPPKVVHRSIISELGWYTADAEALGKQIAGFNQKAEVDPISNVIAMILPHAGYRFSGQIAADALKATDKKYSRIIVIGPSHRAYMEEMLSIPRVTHYETPLGRECRE